MLLIPLLPVPTGRFSSARSNARPDSNADINNIGDANEALLMPGIPVG